MFLYVYVYVYYVSQVDEELLNAIKNADDIEKDYAEKHGKDAGTDTHNSLTETEEEKEEDQAAEGNGEHAEEDKHQQHDEEEDEQSQEQEEDEEKEREGGDSSEEIGENIIHVYFNTIGCHRVLVQWLTSVVCYVRDLTDSQCSGIFNRQRMSTVVTDMQL